MNARKIALEILRLFDEGKSTLEALIDRLLNRSGMDRRDRRLAYELVYGTLRHRIRLRYVVAQFLSDPKLADEQQLMRILELGLYQVAHLDRVPNHAAVSESVNLAKASAATRRFTGVVNAVLRAAITKRTQVSLPDPKQDLPYRLSIEYAHPKWMVERWLDRYGLSNTRSLLGYNNNVPETFYRRRIRGMGRAQFESDTRGICDRAGGPSNLFYRLSRKGMAPDELRLFQLGYCTVQAPSAGWVVASMAIQPGERCVDMCSAPGGKTAFMAELAGEDGSVCAGDISYRRLQLVLNTVERLGLRTVYPLACDAAHPPFAGFFDKALLDVPCSGSGVLHRHPDARSSRTPGDIARIAERQEVILEAGAELIGPGGLLVYATCSLEPEENEEQVGRFLERHGEFSLERPPMDVPRQYVDLDGYLRITPFEHKLDGAFAALLRKRS